MKFYTFDNTIKCKCGCYVGYDAESTLYLKCPVCGEVLIYRNVEDKHLVPEKSSKISKKVVDNDLQ